MKKQGTSQFINMSLLGGRIVHQAAAVHRAMKLAVIAIMKQQKDKTIMKNQKIWLITGVSRGLGKALAQAVLDQL